MKLLIHLLVLLPFSVIGQKNIADKGIVYYTLGTDTTIIQYFEYDNHSYKTTFIQFTGAITKCEAEGLLDKNGDLKEVRSSNYRITTDGKWEMTTKGINTFDGDSTIYVAVNPQGAVVNRRSFSGRGILAIGMDIASFYVFPYMGFYAPQKKGDTLFHRQLSFNGFRNYMVNRSGNGELRIGSNLMGYLTCLIDSKGRLQQIEGIGSSLNIRAAVNRVGVTAAVLDSIAIRRNGIGGTAVRTLRDTARVVLGSTTIEIDYWRPHKRGREIFGNVVPWNRVWRTGANNATQLRITSDIIIGGRKLAKGIYGIWSYPAESTWWELIINKNANAWGTDHDPAADVFRVQLVTEKIETFVEVMKISFVKKDEKTATLLIEWDVYRAFVQVAVD